jgi:hypothetical protein
MSAFLNGHGVRDPGGSCWYCVTISISCNTGANEGEEVKLRKNFKATKAYIALSSWLLVALDFLCCDGMALTKAWLAKAFLVELPQQERSRTVLPNHNKHQEGENMKVSGINGAWGDEAIHTNNSHGNCIGSPRRRLDGRRGVCSIAMEKLGCSLPLNLEQIGKVKEGSA